ETITPMGKGVENLKYRIQVTPANCVGCGLCAVECPGKAGNKALEMVDINGKLGEEPLADYLFKHTEYKTGFFPADTVKGSQFM
ncbi:4Fe-4S binding protein, partial [Erysipelatoclostridium ramosum]|uniref:4Fe-4S binding protein n=1 Tax=Thomasclavelia ramosa TaxID=1547 RepID=UPI001D0816A8